MPPRSGRIHDHPVSRRRLEPKRQGGRSRASPREWDFSALSTFSDAGRHRRFHTRGSRRPKTSKGRNRGRRIAVPRRRTSEAVSIELQGNPEPRNIDRTSIKAPYPAHYERRICSPRIAAMSLGTRPFVSFVSQLSSGRWPPGRSVSPAWLRQR
jgi:hypothetical protein